VGPLASASRLVLSLIIVVLLNFSVDRPSHHNTGRKYGQHNISLDK
jgi:hypothetical protein